MVEGVIKKETWDDLHRKMEELGIDEDDLLEKFILGSGSGGQKIQKTHSCVYIKHIPSGLEVKCQKERSRELNRYYARRELCEKIAKAIHKVKTEKEMAAAKIRRQKRRRSRRSKEKMLEEKHRRSELKSKRMPPGEEE